MCLTAGEDLFTLGRPGTTKAHLVQELRETELMASVFDYLLTRFTEPNELFAYSIFVELHEGELVTNTEGMLPEAALVFLDN